MVASYYGYKDIVQHLVIKGAIVDYKNKKGSTALMFACTHNHFDVVEYLIEHDADVNIQPKSHFKTWSFY